MRDKGFKKFTVVLLTMLLLLGMLPGVGVQTAYAATGDSASDPILVYTAAGLENIQNGLSKHYKLMADIDLSDLDLPHTPFEEKWTPLGRSGSLGFSGSIDGNGHTISNLQTIETMSGTGLVGSLHGGTIKNLKLTNVNIDTMYSNVGGLVGLMYQGSIINCSVSGSVKGKGDVGGLVGANVQGTISNSCATEGTVTGIATTTNNSVGGLVGYNNGGGGASGDITRCFSNMTVVLSGSGGNNRVGGFVGYINGGDITNCYATGNVTTNSVQATVGGFVGKIADGYGSAHYCYTSGTLSGTYNASQSGPFNQDSGDWGVRYSYYNNSAGTGGKGTPLTPAQLRVQENFSGWDFTGVWGIGSGINNGYPYLRAILPDGYYSVIYNGNDSNSGSVPIDANIYAAGATATALDNTGSLSKSGYIFAGWNTALDGSGTDYAAGDDFTVGSSDVTLYARWIPGYAVNFETNGGITVPSQAVGANTTAVRPADPTKTDCVFAGWYSDINLTVAVDFSAPITANTTFYAKWLSLAAVADSALNEGGLDSRTLTLTLTGDTFKNDTISSANIILNNAPDGLSVLDVSKAGSTQAAVTLSFDGADFDSSIHNFSVTIKAMELTGGIEVTSGFMTITAVTDDAVLTASDSGISSQNEDGEAITVTITGGTFVGTLTPANWTVSNLPAGVIVGDVVRTDTTHAQITLSGNATDAYADDITNVQVACTAAEYRYSGGGDTLWTLGGVVLRGTTTLPVLTAEASVLNEAVADDGSIAGSQTVTLTNGTFTGTNGGTVAGATVNHLPAGLTADVVKTSDTELTISFTGKATNHSIADSVYDVSVTVPQAAVNDAPDDMTTGSFAIEFIEMSASITYHLDSGTNPDGAPETYAYGTDVTLPTPTKTGYTFAGWYADSGFSGSALTTISAADTGAKEYWARWTPKSYTVTFDRHGGNGGTSSVTATYGQTPANVAAPTRSGYTFGGYYTAANGGGTQWYTADGNAAGVWTVANDTTLYAKWTARINTITFESNGGTTFPDQSVETGATAAKPADPIKTGHSFVGWYTDSGLTSIYSFTAPVTGDMTLYARWTANVYIVAYNGNGSTSGSVPASQSYNYQTTVTAAVYGSLEKTGYSFDGWNTVINGSGDSYNENDTFFIGASDMTLYAQWLVNSYTVTYHDNGADSGTTPAAVSYDYLTTVTAAVYGSLEKNSYVFGGWNTESGGFGTDYGAAFEFPMPARDLDLYAKWIPACSVIYNGNGNTAGSVPVDNAAYMSGDPVTAANNSGSLTRIGYTFSGWNTAADGSGTDYAAGSGSFHMPSSGIVLYAAWEPVDYHITYNGNGNTSGIVPTDATSHHYLDSVALAAYGSLTRTGHVFIGWNTAANGSGSDYANGGNLIMGDSDVTLYAKWTPQSYTVAYNGNGATSGTEPASVTTHVYGSTVTVNDNSGNLARTGYSFTCWNTAADGSGDNYAAGGGSFIMGASNVVLYAKWTENDDDNDGTPDSEDTDPNDPDVPNQDNDDDGIPNSTDPDDDNDGTSDSEDTDPNDPDVPNQDNDDDGIPNSTNQDDDNDGTPDSEDTDPNDPNVPNQDNDDDGIPNSTDPDDDNDGTPDSEDTDPNDPDVPNQDNDDDGIPNSTDPDDDNDGTPDATDSDPNDPDEGNAEILNDYNALAVIYADGDSAAQVTRSVFLTGRGASGNTTITWSTSDTSYVTATGRVTRPGPEAADASVTLTAVITDNSTGAQRIKVFTLTIPKMSNTEAVKDAAGQLSVSSAFTFSGDDTWECITTQFLLLTAGVHGTTVSWSSDNTAVIRIESDADSTRGIITRSTVEDMNVILTATIVKEGYSVEKKFLLVVKNTSVTKNSGDTRQNTSRNADVTINPDVTAANQSVQILRTTLNDGTRIDTVVVAANDIQTLTDGINPQETDDDRRTIRIVTTQPANDKADELAFEIPAAAVGAMADKNALLSIQTDEGSISLDKDSVAALADKGTDLYFRIVPVKDSNEQDTIKNQMAGDNTVLIQLGNQNLTALGTPIMIETNYTGVATKVVLPFTGITIPAQDRAAFLDSLRIYIQHSDGTTAFITGTIRYDGGGNPVGIEFVIDKFSSFQLASVTTPSSSNNDNNNSGSNGQADKKKDTGKEDIGDSKVKEAVDVEKKDDGSIIIKVDEEKFREILKDAKNR